MPNWSEELSLSNGVAASKILAILWSPRKRLTLILDPTHWLSIALQDVAAGH